MALYEKRNVQVGGEVLSGCIVHAAQQIDRLTAKAPHTWTSKCDVWTRDDGVKVEARLAGSHDKPWWVTRVLGKGKARALVFLGGAWDRTRTFKTAANAMRAADKDWP